MFTFQIWKMIPFALHCGIFIFGHTWYDFPIYIYFTTYGIAILTELAFVPFMVIIILPNWAN